MTWDLGLTTDYVRPPILGLPIGELIFFSRALVGRILTVKAERVFQSAVYIEST